MIQNNHWQQAIRFSIIGMLIAILTACGVAPPRNSENICSIFTQYPRWYWEASHSYQKWGIPVNVQFAIIRQESSFDSNARPPREKLAGLIPWARPTTAFGYAQAVNDTWVLYQKDTNNYKTNRDEFAAAVDFLGWYGNLASRQLHIPKNNAYAMYLAYHEGIQGYTDGTYHQKPWLIVVAKNVQTYAKEYQSQLQGCEQSIPKPSIWNLWLT